MRLDAAVRLKHIDLEQLKIMNFKLLAERSAYDCTRNVCHTQ